MFVGYPGGHDMPDDNPTTKPNASSEAIATLYTALQQLTIHGQENKSSTLYNFLLVNSFLLVAWATLFSQTSVWLDGAACTLLCLIGVLACLAWEPLGRDYADASDLFRSKLVEFEQFLPPAWPRAFEAREQQIDKKKEGTWRPFSTNRVRSRHLLVYTPRVLVVGYTLFLVLSWGRVWLK